MTQTQYCTIHRIITKLAPPRHEIGTALKQGFIVGFIENIWHQDCFLNKHYRSQSRQSRRQSIGQRATASNSANPVISVGKWRLQRLEG